MELMKILIKKHTFNAEQQNNERIEILEKKLSGVEEKIDLLLKLQFEKEKK